MPVGDTFSALSPFPGRLQGKTALVTGAASGLGAAISARLAAEGANVVLADIDQEGLATQTALIGSNALACPLDVTSAADWKMAMETTITRFGQLDVLVNNAGITTMGSIEELDADAFRYELEIDVIGVFLGCKFGVAVMKERGGSIINMSSSAGLKAYSYLVGYNAAKAAVTLMTKSIALHCAENGYGIRCNSVHPGAIRTAIIDKVLAQVDDPEATLAGFEAAHPVGHLGHPDDISAIVAYLASDESRFATGAAFSVDGGATAS
jgi:NAD(P)-dependent dehydrogenase (short-subunit alcohol dehydrogenase family)